MFTGIVQGTATVRAAIDEGALRRLVLDFPPGALAGIERGASVAIGGVCLTVVAFGGDEAGFDVIPETLDKTTLGGLVVGDAVNFERSASFGKEIGGHLLSGHVSDTAEVVRAWEDGHDVGLQLRVGPELVAYVLPKGFVALDGCSLTIGRVDEAEGTFTVHLIPETLAVTTLGKLGEGHRVNLEIDAMTQAVVATVRRYLQAREAP